MKLLKKRQYWQHFQGCHYRRKVCKCHRINRKHFLSKN